MNQSYQVKHSDIPLLEYNNIFVANLLWIKRGVHKDIATFDLVVRELPTSWSFYVFDGLERCVDLLLKHGFDEDAITLLKQMNLIDSLESEEFYRNYKFTGDFYSLKDGTIFFPGTPIVRVTAPVAEVNLLTAFFLNVFSYPIRILTKTVRVKFACAGTLFYAGSLARLPGFEQGIDPQRSAYILGSPVGSPLFYRKYPQITPPGKLVANINHALIKSFSTERQAFHYVFETILSSVNFIYVMVDTYNFENGLETFIEELKNISDGDYSKVMITIDSGDIYSRSLYARKRLNEDGMQAVRIQAMGDLDEYKIDALIKGGAAVDCYITATALINITDNPKLEAVFKMAELRRQDGTVEQKAKLAKGKESYPGRKQVFRLYDKAGQMSEDIIGFEDEDLGDPLLHQFISSGKLIGSVPDVHATKGWLEKQLSLLPAKYKGVFGKADYKISVSQKMQAALEQVKQIHL